MMRTGRGSARCHKGNVWRGQGNRWRYNVAETDQHVEIQLRMLLLGSAASNLGMITIKIVEIVGLLSSSLVIIL